MELLPSNKGASSCRSFLKRLKTFLENWIGEDDAGRRASQKVAEEIDFEMQEYLRAIPQKTQVILKGQQDHERRVA